MHRFMLWLRYVCVWPGVRPYGSRDDVDYLIGQAFGRNTYTDAELYTVAEIHEANGADPVKTLDALRAFGVDIGQPNRELATEIKVHLTGNRIPATVQWELALGWPREWFIANRDRIKLVFPPVTEGKYLSTRGVFMASLVHMSRVGARTPLLVAHERMLPRCLMMAHRLGFNPVVSGEAVTRFDGNSVQLWTKHPLLWTPREAFARWVHHPLLHWV